jgi:tetratricopeptide (TPR) repeat protein
MGGDHTPFYRGPGSARQLDKAGPAGRVPWRRGLEAEAGVIEADAYELFQRGRALLAARHAHQAVTVLERARQLEPGRGSVAELLARAYYASGRLGAARAAFAEVVERNPTNDYAHFGLALCLLKMGQRPLAVGHLRLARAMRPDVADYEQALARAAADHPGQGDDRG